MDRHNTVVKTHLRKLKILPREWEVLSQLTKVLSVGQFSTFPSMITFYSGHLQPFLEAMLRLSQKKIPLLHKVIPIIDILTERLDNISSDRVYLTSVRTGAAKGLAVLNKYYAKTDELAMYRCAMSMCYLLSYMFLNHTNSHPTWQYFIPGINWHTSGRRNGLKTGSTRQNLYYESNGQQITSRLIPRNLHLRPLTCHCHQWVVILFLIIGECLDLILMWYRLQGTAYSHHLMTSAPMTCQMSSKNT